MIKVLFFAQTREILGLDEIEVEGHFATVQALRDSLATRSDKWALAMEPERLLMAVNQTIVQPEASVADGDEVAFFPPVTGG
ncbi:Molybdopterin synthase sulfur carrier subunit [Vibrio aerogenes CECT 7868]|uniref:Molybdopterin synthase sulfur carrier subunit n=1 Tax=Vibrio aerogenes CECT 7868 TaxID=1216006 RepID=A0A1M6B3V3_9VIBR|nr:molybdopterin synthase sulfur carrier subunit [Vibrio aerogenes]SHI43133.1 Molybdopterin synthase sulfur carrier subunit [Vibrio aerogenes CECT 7868]